MVSLLKSESPIYFSFTGCRPKALIFIIFSFFNRLAGMILHNTPLLVYPSEEQCKVSVNIAHATGQKPSPDHEISL